MAVTSVGSIAMKITSVEEGVVVGDAALFSWAEACYIRVIFLKEQ